MIDTASGCGVLGTNVGYTGHVQDNTGLVYAQQRYYDPQIGRFLSTDSVLPHAGDPRCFGRYNYAANNPYKYVDPCGEAIWLAAAPAAGKAVISGVSATGSFIGGWVTRALASKAVRDLGIGTLAAIALNGASDSDETDKPRTILGEVEVTDSDTPETVREKLSNAGMPPVGNAQDEGSSPNREPGTVHISPDGKVRIRVMDGNKYHGPRFTSESPRSPKNKLDIETGKTFPNQASPEQRGERSHIPLRGTGPR